jgi:molecular chaperone GrpE (heat shock protein)
MPKKQHKSSQTETAKEAHKKAEEYLAGWKRTKADFENYKKEEKKRFEEFGFLLKMNFVLQLLPILDSFERALKSLKDKEKKSDWAEGIFKIKGQLEDFLKKEGAEEIKAEGQEFNPAYHEAVGELVVKDAKKKDKVVQVLQKGYKIGERVIRPARVYVGK